MGGCSMSEKLCYFCREHEMRPLPAGKQGQRRKKEKSKVLSGYWPWLRKLTHTHTLLCNLGGVARWLQTHTQRLTEMNCLAWDLEVGSSSVFAVHQHLSSGGEMMRRERRGVTKREKRKGGGGDWGRDLLKHSDWKLDLWISSFSSLQSPVSPSHVMCKSRKDHSPSCHVKGVLAVSPWP